MRWRGKRIKLFPICTDEKLQVKGNPLVQDLATCTVPRQLKATVVSIGCNSRLIIHKKHWQRSFILQNLHPQFSVPKLLKKRLWFCTFHTTLEVNMSSFNAIPVSQPSPQELGVISESGSSLAPRVAWLATSGYGWSGHPRSRTWFWPGSH